MTRRKPITIAVAVILALLVAGGIGLLVRQAFFKLGPVVLGLDGPDEVGLLSERTPTNISSQMATAGFKVMAFSNGQILGDGVLTVSSVPEPGPAAMLAVGLAALGWMARRRKA